MAVGTCQRCGAGQVRCKGLCARCYFARRYERPEGGVGGVETRAFERAWDARQLVAALVAELPEPGRHQGASWAARAACRAHPGLPWDGRLATAEMRAVCRACPVTGPCLAEALADPGVAGVWAGTTAAERARLRR